MVPNKKNFISQDAADLVDLDEVVTKKRVDDLRLMSNLFKGDLVLNRIAEGRIAYKYDALEPDQNLLNNPNVAVSKIQLALMIVLPELAVPHSSEAKQLFKDFHGDRTTSPVFFADGKYGELTDKYVRKFQEHFTAAPRNLVVDGIVGSETIIALDEELDKIYYYDIDKQKTIHNRSKSRSCGYYTVCAKPAPVDANDVNDPDNTLTNLNYKAYLYEEPTPTARKLGVIPFNMRVRIIDILDSGWCFVEIDAHPDTYQLNQQKNIYERRRMIPVENVTSPQLNKVGIPLRYYSPKEGGAKTGTQYFRYLVPPPGWTAYYFSEPPGVPPSNPPPPPTPPPGGLDPNTIDPEKIVKYFTRGYMLLSDLWTHSEIPDPDAQLHKIKVNQFLSHIVPIYYGTGLTNSQQLFYWHALLYCNNPEGTVNMEQYRLDQNTGTFSNNISGVPASLYMIHNKQSWLDILDPDLWDGEPVVPVANSSWDNWESILRTLANATSWDDTDIHTVTYKYMWIPDKRYADSLKDTIDIGINKGSNSIEDYISSLWNITVATFNGTLIEALLELWPEGMGYNVEGGLGVTFGIPIEVHADKYLYFYRDSPDTFKLIRRGKLGGGLNSQVGLGFYLGSGKRSNRRVLNPSDANSKYGLGGQIAAGLQVGVEVGIHEEFVFDFRKDHAIAKMLIAILGIDPLVTIAEIVEQGSIASKFFTNFKMHNLDPTDYRTKVSVEIIGYGHAGAGISGGLKTGTQDARSYWESGTARASHGKGKAWSLTNLLTLLNITIGWDFNIEQCVGVEVIFKDWHLDESLGIYIPDITEANIYTEAETALAFSTHIQALNSRSTPFIGIPITLPAFRFGFGIKWRWTFGYDVSTFGNVATISTNTNHVYGPRFIYQGCSIYYKSGTFDVYDGTASRVEVAFQEFATWPPTMSEILANVTKITIKRRMGIDAVVGSKYKAMTAKGFVNKLAAKSYGKLKREYGFILEGYITFGFEFDAQLPDVQTAITNLMNEFSSAVSDVGELIWYILSKFVLGQEPDEPEFMNTILQTLCDPINLDALEVRAHLGYGVGVAFGVGVGVGLTARLQVNFSFIETWDWDMSQDFRDAIAEAQNSICDAAQVFLQMPETIDSRYKYDLDPDKSKFSGWLQEGDIGTKPIKESEQ